MSSRIDRFRKIAMNCQVGLESKTDLFPDEELEQLRSRLNPIVLRQCHKSLLPHWAEQEILSNTVSNNKHRNWGVIGGVGGKAYGIIDRFGSIWAYRECGSIDIFALHNGSIIRPDGIDDIPELRLISPEDQVYEWTVIIGPIEFTRLIYYVNYDGNEAVYNEIRIRNLALEEKQFNFLVVIKPFSPLGFEPIESIEFDSENNALYSNGFLACLMNETPSNITITTCDDPCLLEKVLDGNANDQSYVSVKGIVTSLMKFTIDLRPAGTKSLFFVSPLSGISKNMAVPEFAFSFSAIERSVDDWFSFAGRRMIGIYPDEFVGKVLAQAKATLVIMYNEKIINKPLDDDIQRSIDIARVLMAMTLSGCGRVIEESYDELVHSLTSEFKHGNCSSFPIAWALFYHFRHYGIDSPDISPDSLIDSLLPLLLSVSYNYLFEPKKSPLESKELLSEGNISGKPSTLEPELSSDESERQQRIHERISLILGQSNWSKLVHPETDYEFSSDKYFRHTMDMIWAHSLLRILPDFLSSDAKLIVKELGSILHKVVQKRLSTLLTIDLTAYQSMSILSSLVSVETPGFKANILSIPVKKIRSNIKKGLFNIGSTKDCLSSHLALRLGEYYAMMKRRHDADELLLKALQYVSSFNTLPDFVNPETLGGCAGDGCSIQAAADIILLVRHMILFYSGNDLILMPGIPEEWFTLTAPMVIHRIPTLFGLLDLEMASSKNQYQIELKMINPPGEIELHLPASFSVSLVKAFGGSIIQRFSDTESSFVRAVPLSERVIFTFHK